MFRVFQCAIETAARMLCVREVIQESQTQPPVTPRKVWSTYVTGVRSQSDPETLVAKTRLLDCNGASGGLGMKDYGSFQV